MSTIEKLNAIATATGLSYFQVAVVAGIGTGTARVAMQHGELPVRVLSRRRIETFVSLNEGARNRADLKFVPG